MRVSKRPEGRMYLTLLTKKDFHGAADPRPLVPFGWLCLQGETVSARKWLLQTHVARKQLMLLFGYRGHSQDTGHLRARKNLKLCPCWVSIARWALPYNITFWRPSSSVLCIKKCFEIHAAPPRTAVARLNF